MLVRNYAKPFCIAGFIVAEIYMVLVVLAPNIGQPLISPMIPETTVPLGAPVPFWYLLVRVLVGSVFFGPLGAVVGLGLGLLFSGLLQMFRRK